MSKKVKDKPEVVCPVGRFFTEMDHAFDKKSKFFKHLRQSHVELLKAVRSLVDERIETLEKKRSAKEKKATKIDVE